MKIGLWRGALAMNSTVGLAEVGLLMRAISVGAVVLRFRNPMYTAPVAGSIAAACACWASSPWPGATTTGLHTVSGAPQTVPFGSKVTRPRPMLLMPGS